MRCYLLKGSLRHCGHLTVFDGTLALHPHPWTEVLVHGCTFTGAIACSSCSTYHVACYVILDVCCLAEMVFLTVALAASATLLKAVKMVVKSCCEKSRVGAAVFASRFLRLNSCLNLQVILHNMPSATEIPLEQSASVRKQHNVSISNVFFEL